MFTYRGGNLLKAIFPDWSPEFERFLAEVIQIGDRVGFEFVAEIMQAYSGQFFLHSICNKIVSAVEPDDPLLDNIGRILYSTGVVSGPFGFAEAYDRRRAQIEIWKTDDRERVRLVSLRRGPSLG